MSDNLINDLMKFLKSGNLSTYEINAFLVILKASKINNLTAREISSMSKVPTGRIYEVLDDLKNKGMIEIIDSRPKTYRSLSLNKVLNNLITHQTSENKRKTSFLYQQARIMESKLYKTNSFIKKDQSKTFWATAFGRHSIFSLYLKHFHELQDELLLINFINKSTLKIISYGKDIYGALRKTIERGIRVKILWSFEYDDRPLLEEEKVKNSTIFTKLKKKLLKYHGLEEGMHDFEMKFVHEKVPTYYDLFDKKRIIFKLQNPVNPWQIFACMDVLDPNLAEELREKFLNLWLFKAIEETDE
ncbi:MAG: TrmB family transcriptional regulator [Promethearchaeota archaeon]